MEKKNGFAKRVLLEASKGIKSLAPFMVTGVSDKISLFWGNEKIPAHLMNQKQD